MKLFLLIVILSFSLSEKGLSAASDTLKYINAKKLKMIGKGFTDTENSYGRLPSGLEPVTRDKVWSLSKNCSGLAIRFHTNSTAIAAKWTVNGDVVMNHFAPTGIKGLDLYCLKNKKWEYVNTARPTGKSSSAVIISNMESKDMEYMLYLPLYDGLSNLEIGVNTTSVIGNPLLNSPKAEKPVVIYGTSITQGGCASRAGMSYPNILSRMLDREIVNLGFSGNGQLDLEIAEHMGNIDASCFVIDCLPNCSRELMKEKYIRFVEIIREKKPSVPILMVENILYPHMYFNKAVYKTIEEKNGELKKIHSELKNKGYQGIYYLKADKLIGDDSEPTVDGVHLTDLGFLRMSENMYPVIKKLIKK